LRGSLGRSWRYLWAGPWSLLGLALAVPALMLGARARCVEGVVEVSGGGLGRLSGRGMGLFNVVAITLGHVVLGSSAEALNRLRAHEHVHVRQYERWGLLFVPAYLADSLWQALHGRRAYRDNRFERSAFSAEVAAEFAAEVAAEVAAGFAAGLDTTPTVPTNEPQRTAPGSTAPAISAVKD